LGRPAEAEPITSYMDSSRGGVLRLRPVDAARRAATAETTDKAAQRPGAHMRPVDGAEKATT